ncbi:hypothetical protein ACHAXN_008912 [Cyclotella atomus]
MHLVNCCWIKTQVRWRTCLTSSPLQLIESCQHISARHISNLAYAYALIGYNPKLDNQTLLQNIGNESIGFIEGFNGQDISNMVWAFATLNVEHPALFQSVGDHIEGLDNLRSFNSQNLANIAWAYASLGIVHHALFEKVGNHIHRSGCLESFKPQELTNIGWAYATGGLQHFGLLKRVGNHIASVNFKWYKPQDFSNVVWAYAAAEVQHPALFERVGDHITQLDNLKAFTPQALANTVWAYATLGVQHPALHSRRKHLPTLYGPSQLQISSDLTCFIEGFNDFQAFDEQAFANIAWAYAVANVDAPTIFNGTFTDALLKRVHAFTVDGRHQLYQWHIWQTKELSHAGLPEDAREQCYQTFATVDATVSRLQKDVVHELRSMDLKPAEKYVTPSGYSIDAFVEVDDRRVGIEVDGPSHFVD